MNMPKGTSSDVLYLRLSIAITSIHRRTELDPKFNAECLRNMSVAQE